MNSFVVRHPPVLAANSSCDSGYDWELTQSKVTIRNYIVCADSATPTNLYMHYVILLQISTYIYIYIYIYTDIVFGSYLR